MKHLLYIVAIYLSFTLELWAETNAFDTKVNSDGVECGFYLDHYPSIQWNGIGSPPINIEKVSNIFHPWVKAKKGSKVSSHIVGYNLWSVIPETHKYSSWVYTINYVNYEGNIPLEPFNEYVVFTMDGIVIESTCPAL